MSVHCVDDLRTIQYRWGKSSEWVKWHGWQYQAVQNPTYMPNSTFLGWRWCHSDANMLQCPYSLTLCGWPQYYSRRVGEEFWVGEMAWMTVPSRPRSQNISKFTFWGWRRSRIAMRTCFSALTVPVLENLFSKRSLTLRCLKVRTLLSWSSYLIRGNFSKMEK